MIVWKRGIPMEERHSMEEEHSAETERRSEM